MPAIGRYAARSHTAPERLLCPEQAAARPWCCSALSKNRPAADQRHHRPATDGLALVRTERVSVEKVLASHHGLVRQVGQPQPLQHVPVLRVLGDSGGSQPITGPLAKVRDGETVLRPGDAAGFKAGVASGHCLINRSSRDAVYLEIGTRSPRDRAEYPDIDLMVRKDESGVRYTRKSGEPYPK